MEQFKKEVDRYFNLYGEFCEKPNGEVVNDLLSSAFRVNERLKKATFNKCSFGSDINFFVLRALRNHFTHAGEIDSNLKGINAELLRKLAPELTLVCLIPKKILNVAINKSENFELAKKANSQFQDIDGYVDIHPFIFNFSVKLFEESFKRKLNIESDIYQVIKRSYKIEKVYEIAHLIEPRPLDLSLLGSGFSDNLISLNDFIVHKSVVDEHQKLVGIHFGGEALSVDFFDFNKVISDLPDKIKTLNGIPVSYYANLLNGFGLWSKSPIPVRLINILEINECYIKKVIEDDLHLLEKIDSEKIRYDILKSKQVVIGHTLSLLLHDTNESKFRYILYCALLISYQIVSEHNDEMNNVQCFLDSVLFERDVTKVNRVFDKIKKNKQALAQNKFFITTQIVMLLLEFPYDDFILDSII